MVAFHRIIREAELWFRYPMMLSLLWRQSRMEVTMMTIIRPILWKFTWNLLRQEDLLTHRELNRRLRILISTCSRNRMFPRLSLLFRFRNIRIFRFRRLCVLRPLGMCR